MYLILLYLGILFKQTLTAVVHEAPIGTLAILDCPSNIDADHRFQYWQLNDDQNVIGPENVFDKHKYAYEVWSGRLIIRSVSSAEAGFYKCISKHVGSSNLNIKAVELIVKRDWEEAFEEDPQANAYRTAIGILSVALVLLLGGVGFFFVRKRRSRNFLAMSREESPQTPPTGTYNPTTTTKKGGSNLGFGQSDKSRSPRPSRVLDHAIVETDIKTSFALPDYD